MSDRFHKVLEAGADELYRLASDVGIAERWMAKIDAIGHNAVRLGRPLTEREAAQVQGMEREHAKALLRAEETYNSIFYR